jgi:hypothetical protein
VSNVFSFTNFKFNKRSLKETQYVILLRRKQKLRFLTIGALILKALEEILSQTDFFSSIFRDLTDSIKITNPRFGSTNVETTFFCFSSKPNPHLHLF